MLPLLANRFEKAVIPETIFGLLLEMKDRILPGQPNRIDQMRDIVETIEKHGIQRIPTQDGFSWAQANDGYFVTSMPPTDAKSAELIPITESMTRYGLNFRRLISDLFSLNAITQWQADSAIASAGTEGTVDALGATIPRGAKLLCSAVSLEYLDQAKLVGSILTEGFKLYVTDADTRFLVAQVAEADQRMRFAHGLEHVRQIVRDSVASGRFELTVDTPSATTLESNAHSFAMLLATARSADILLVDDRFCNAHINNDKGARILSTLDVLSALNASEKLSDEDLFRSLLDARRGGLFFIPLSSSELHFHLKSTRIHEGHVLESRSLRIIRHYIGASLSPAVGLRLVSPDDERPYLHTLDDALAASIDLCQTSDNADAWREYIVVTLHAAEISALRKAVDSNELSAFRSLDDLVRRLEA